MMIMMELLAQIEGFDGVELNEIEDGYYVEIDDSDGMPLALDQLLDELADQCLEVIDEHEFGYSFVFDGFQVVVMFVGDYD